MRRSTRDPRRRAHPLPWTLLLALLVLASGCISLADDAEEVQIPEPPSDLEAIYSVSVDDRPLMTVAVDGFDASTARLGDDTTRSAVALELSYQREGWRDWTLTLHHTPDGERLLGAQLTCQGEAGGEIEEACPRNDPEEYQLVHHDAYDAPGLLGLGPFVGTGIHPGDSGSIELWDPVDPGELGWTATAASVDREAPCVEVTYNWTEPGAKTPIPTAPYNRSITACQGIPLPVELSVGPILWQLESVTDGGEPLEASGPGPDDPPVRATSSSCSVDFPPHNETQLPSPTYMEWAEENDSTVSTWVQEHPDGFAFPSVAHASTSGEEGTTSNAYNVVGSLLLFDPEERSMRYLWMEEQHQQTLILEESEFQETEEFGSSSGIPPMARMCPDEAVELAGITSAVEDRLVDSTVQDTFLAPEMMAGIQGSGPWIWPYQMDRDAWEPIRELFEPTTWPYRAYVNYIPSDGRVALLDAASVDPAGDWIRWLELEDPG